MTPFASHALAAAGLAALTALPAAADPVTDWNVKAGEIVVESKLGTPPAIRVLAIVQTAVDEAVTGLPPPAARGGPALEAALAAVHHVTFARLLPAQQASIDAAVRTALGGIADGPAKELGIATGTRAAQAVLAARADDTPGADAYRPHALPGVYVPTPLPAAASWVQRKPWLMTSAAQFRPPAPPALTSERWAQDYDEVRALGSKTGSRRSAEQTEIARFWEYSLPPIYHAAVRSLADQPGRSPAANARLLAAATQAMDDAMIGVFEAKYHYNFWRPVTAIRNGDADGHPATVRDAGWTSFIDTPLHPEYPSAHSILAAAVGTVLEAEFGPEPARPIATSSPTAKGATRRWPLVADFVREVSEARIYDGVHFRFSTEVGEAMGRQIGRLAAERVLHATPSLQAHAVPASR